MKSLQFRNIAPKAPAAVPSSSPALPTCLPPSTLPEACTASSPNSIIVPAQNYALMQIAGQDGTFSLVALPKSVSSQTSQPQPHTNNLKLPIPRYQPPRCKSNTDKAKAPPTPKARNVPKATGTQTKLLPKVLKEELSDRLVSLDQASSETVLCPASQLEPKAESSQCAATAGLVQNIQYPAPGIQTSPGKVPEEVKAAVQLCQSKPSGGLTVLSSTAIFSKAVQIIPSPPKGKVPILPYAKVNNGLIPASTLCSTTTEDSQAPEPQQNQVRTGLFPILGPVQKATGKRRGRKKKTLEDILAFEARKKRSLSFFRRRVPDKPPSMTPSKEKEVDISKKYRSIRPKPMLLMETVPQLVGLPALAAHRTSPPPASVGLHPPHSRLHRCPTCSRSFQFKHHLTNHMYSHSNSRPYVCPLCRKAYAHSGSLSTHMKLHHAEVRPRRALSCDFCHKNFGYVGVYFSHLREVHKVLLTVEPSISQHEDHTHGSMAEVGEEAREDPVELQIKCGRCQAITPTFTDMKMHLRHVHGEDLPLDRALRYGREAEDELVQHAAHYWRQLNHKRNVVKCGSCDAEFFSFSKLKRHMQSQHLAQDASPERGGGLGLLSSGRDGAALNCVLCRDVCESRERLLQHWSELHQCEQPALLWDALSAYTGPEELDTPHLSPR
ncbi:unnamed protein product [Knipowitschia caucasica]|uniref:C2H2-type domain-containing protein n=1 Tax=Knipowitschia caucasica TaxID=637954 RepID=A0AAV2JFL7_KNICA